MLLLISNSGNACGHAYCMIILRLEIDHLIQVPGFVGAAVHAIQPPIPQAPPLPAHGEVPLSRYALQRMQIW